VAVDAPEQVIGRNMLVEAEIIKQPRQRLLNPHHRLSPAESAGIRESRHRPGGND
jgi:hypothetical protein